MRNLLTLMLGKLLSKKLLAAVLIPGSLVMFGGLGLALNAIFNPPQALTGRKMIQKYLVDGFQRDKTARRTSRSGPFLTRLNRETMLKLSGYALDEAAINRHPKLAYRSRPSAQPSGPMPLLQETGPDLQMALDRAGAIPTPGQPALRLPVPSPASGASLNESSRVARSEGRDSDGGQGPGIGFRPGDGNQEGSGPQIGFRPSNGAGDDGEEGEEQPSPVPLPAPFWLLLAGLMILTGWRLKSQSFAVAKY